MPTNVFLGLNGNWADPANWSLGAIPVNDNDVVIPDTTQTSLTTNLDQTGLDLSSLYVHEGYGGNIGSLGNPLKLQVSGLVSTGTPDITMKGSGSFYFDSEGAAGTGNVLVNSRNTVDAFVLSGAKGVTNLSCLGGAVQLSAGAVGGATAVYVTQTGVTAPSFHDYNPSSAAALVTDLYVTAGTVEYDGLTTNVHIHGGMVTANATSRVGTMRMSNGLCIYNGSPQLLGGLMLFGGTVDMTRTASAKTITNLYKAAKGTLLRNVNLTITNNYELFDIVTE